MDNIRKVYMKKGNHYHAFRYAQGQEATILDLIGKKAKHVETNRKPVRVVGGVSCPCEIRDEEFGSFEAAVVGHVIEQRFLDDAQENPCSYSSESAKRILRKYSAILANSVSNTEKSLKIKRAAVLRLIREAVDYQERARANKKADLDEYRKIGENLEEIGLCWKDEISRLELLSVRLVTAHGKAVRKIDKMYSRNETS